MKLGKDIQQAFFTHFDKPQQRHELSIPPAFAIDPLEEFEASHEQAEAHPELPRLVMESDSR